ncbi:unnamed protein product [Nippostrongylus brasiliensis]|uniref:Transposase n=1 Tax=Nippostrongylus brasiliensis TaxID=27835 RepID=A0A0N4Y620_NIPBR|nr:unnamed protein product [Nippostrongylus brasiliensis]
MTDVKCLRTAMMKLHIEGVPASEIATRLGISSASVQCDPQSSPHWYSKGLFHDLGGRHSGMDTGHGRTETPCSLLFI